MFRMTPRIDYALLMTRARSSAGDIGRLGRLNAVTCSGHKHNRTYNLLDIWQLAPFVSVGAWLFACIDRLDGQQGGFPHVQNDQVKSEKVKAYTAFTGVVCLPP